MQSLSKLKKLIYRSIKYAVLRPTPPSLDTPFSGPVVVVGSAPQSQAPKGISENFCTITVNGSQSVVEKWGIEAPDITFMQFNQIRGKNTNAVEVRRVLNGRKTGKLYVFLWTDGYDALKEGLRNFDYDYGKLAIVDKYQRMALLQKVCGLRSAELDADQKCSNGVNAILFALYHKAPAVIITGINPNASGHAYNSENLERLHTQMDAMVLELLLKKGYPIFTSDPHIVATTGIPLWTGA